MGYMCRQPAPHLGKKEKKATAMMKGEEKIEQ